MTDLFSELQDRRKSGLGDENAEEFSEEHSRLKEMLSTFDPELAKARVRASMTLPATIRTQIQSDTERRATKESCIPTEATSPPAKKKRTGGCTGVDLEKFLQEHLPQVNNLTGCS